MKQKDILFSADAVAARFWKIKGAQMETKAYTDGTTATGPAPLPDRSPRQQEEEECPQCNSIEWDRITNRVSPGEVFNRCHHCGNEWGAE